MVFCYGFFNEPLTTVQSRNDTACAASLAYIRSDTLTAVAEALTVGDVAELDGGPLVASRRLGGHIVVTGVLVLGLTS